MNELEQLHHRISELEKSETKHKQTEEKLKATNQQLIVSEQEIKKHVHNQGERVKELQCLYGVSESIQKRTTLEEIFHDVVKLIPPGWHYPEITRGKVRFDGKEYLSQAFKESKWKQSANIIVNGKVRGSIVVYYLEERPQLDEGPFMKEERNLIDGIVKTISEAIERKKAEEEQKAANQQLAASEQTLEKEKEFSEKIIETSSAVIVGLDKDHLIRIFNKGAEKSTGYLKTEVIGRDWFQIFFPTELIDDMNKVWNDAWGTKTHSYINPVRTKDGNERIISWQTTGMYEEKDITKHLLISIGEDITERKQTEEALGESETKFRLLADHTHDWEYWIDPDGNYIYLSPSCKRITGYPPEEFQSNPDLLFNIVRPDFKEAVHHHYNDENSKQAPVFSMEFPIITKSGKECWLEHNCSPVFDDEGNYAGRRGNNRNITERKQAEEKLISKNKELQTFYDAAVGRELKVIELKKEINELLEKSGEKPKYETPV